MKFVRATKRGFAWATKNPDKAAAQFVKRYPDQDAKLVATIWKRESKLHGTLRNEVAKYQALANFLLGAEDARQEARRPHSRDQRVPREVALRTTALIWADEFGDVRAVDAGLYLPVGGLVEAGQIHVDNEHRLARLRTLIASRPVEAILRHRTPRAATREELARVHTSAHIDAMWAGAPDAGDGLSPLDPNAFSRAALGAGAAILAVEEVMTGSADNAFALVRHAGHHAVSEHGGGFCVFNNVAIAARAAQADHGVNRLAIVDIDVHHGNGTEAIFYEDPCVLTISLHQEGLFPPDTGSTASTGSAAGVGRET